ncbi:hypothetical protein MSG28_011706 [Choristoneura fumiferana]|uniref:Uncharacterized protein n=1 Tax=Choristoneura fumiferana TaxID=7141 RepID=A0ACC0KMA3_CHOFU|nr:hypothetical protein MSG28_011706 [Choristoneura fumiferana]
MVSLNMSQLNLSSVRSQPPQENGTKSISEAEAKLGAITIQDSEDEYHCEYREDIWQHLLEQEKDKLEIHLQSPQQLRDINKKLGLTIATLHSAAALLDQFMDAHRLRADRLTHISNVHLCGKTFRQLEWMVGQHVRWRLLAPTPVTFAALLAQYVVTDGDLTTRHPKMMQTLKSRDAPVESETDQGYSSAKTSPNQTPSTSPHQVSPASSTCSTSTRSYVNVDTSYRQHPVQASMYSVLDLNAANLTNVRDCYLPAVDMTVRVDNPNDYRYFKSRRLIEASLEGQPSTSMAVKRGLEANVDLDRKRYRLTQISQVVQ